MWPRLVWCLLWASQLQAAPAQGRKRGLLALRARDELLGKDVNLSFRLDDGLAQARAVHFLCRQSSAYASFWACAEATSGRFAALGAQRLEFRRLPLEPELSAAAPLDPGWERYLSLLKASLLGALYPPALSSAVAAALKQGEYGVHKRTMLSSGSLDSLRAMVARVDADGVPGDLFEAGVWRGGAVAWLRGVLEAGQAPGGVARRVWAADSFQGLPMRSYIPPRFAGSEADSWFLKDAFHVSEESVRTYLALYGLLDDRVVFARGFFNESLPELAAGVRSGEGGSGAHVPLGDIAILRIDCDMYESYMDVLYNLVERVPPGGFVVADDYSLLPDARLALDEFRAAHGITEPLRWATAEQLPEDPVYFRLPARVRPRRELHRAMLAARRQVAARQLVDLPDGTTVAFEQAMGEPFEKALRRACDSATDSASCIDSVRQQAERHAGRVFNAPRSLGEAAFRELGI